MSFFFFEIIEGESLWRWPNGNDWVENFVTKQSKEMERERGERFVELQILYLE